MLIGNRSMASSGGQGGGASDCTLYTCTLTNNLGMRGGGAHSSTLYNCRLLGNSSAYYAGGAYKGTYFNCLFAGNYTTAAGSDGGGARDATLYNCTVAGNTVLGDGGGVWGGRMINTVVYGNTAGTANINWFEAVVFTNSCTTPAQAGWAEGNRAADPRFADAAAGNYRLRGSSPCLDAGIFFSWMSVPANVHSRDLDGQPRIRYDRVDMGAYETLHSGTTIQLR